MNISGIRPMVGFYDYNEIQRTPDILTTPKEDVATAPKEKEVPQQRTSEVEAKQTFGAYDYAKRYQANETYSLKGEESDLYSLDVKKAVSDMQKDEVLHQYQYFVGAQLRGEATDGIAKRGVEDFIL